MEDDPQYDIAISYLDADEAIARALKERLQERWNVFLYSERQTVLGGADGLEKLSAVFRRHARIVVVLFRDGWGRTKWTRVEETAIKERALEDGWDCIVVVALKAAQGAPAWLPSTKIWVSLERFGLESTAAIVDARAQERGVVPLADDAISIAGRLAAAKAKRAARDRLLESEDGVRLATSEVDVLFKRLAEIVNGGSEHVPGIQIQQSHGRDPTCVVWAGRSQLRLNWHTQFSNSLSDARLYVGEGDRQPVWSRGSEAADYSLRFTLDRDSKPAWDSDEDANELCSSFLLAERLMKSFFRRVLHEDGD